MKKSNIILTVMAVVLLSVSSCSVSKSTNKKSEKVTRVFNVDNFNKISLIGSGEIFFRQSDTVSVKLACYKENLDNVKITSKDGILSINNNRKGIMRGLFSMLREASNTDIYVYITAPDLSYIDISGAGEINIEEPMKTKTFAMDVKGACDVDIEEIICDSMSISISGAGNVKMKEKNVKMTEMYVSGASDSDIEMDSCINAKVRVSGAAEINLSGTLQHLESSVSGAGEINTKKLKLK